MLDRLHRGKNAQAFAEVVPFIKGYNYGRKEPTLWAYRLDADGETVPLADVPEELRKLCVPVLYAGPCCTQGRSTST